MLIGLKPCLSIELKAVACVATAFLVLPNFHLCFYLTIRPVRSRKGYGSIAHEAKGFSVTQLVGQKKQLNKVCKCKLKKDIFGNKTKEFRYSMTITNSPLVV